jgi:hypothetical protein
MPPHSGISAARLNPFIQVGAAINDLAAEAVEGWALHLMPPLGQFVAITDNIEFRISQDIAAIIFKEVGHCKCSFRCLEWQRMDAP